MIKSQPLDAYYSALSKEIESSQKAPKFKVGDRVRITKYKKLFSKSNIIDAMLKTNPWTYEIKDLNKEKIIGSFYEKELLLRKL